MDWSKFSPQDFEYDFERDELAAHRVTFDIVRIITGMDDMKKKRVKTEREIDEAVIVTADDNAAWEKPLRVRRAKSESVSLPAEMAARAAFFARLHREPNLEQWIKRIVSERIDIEEAAFAASKRELGT
jgi:hypothetical protein